MHKIRMAEGVEFPADVVTQKIAFIARSGMGKTYAATKLAEGMLAQGAQIVVLDPVGVWWGLRLLKDGKTPSAFNVPIFGGDHQDLPLEPQSGEFVARLAAETGTSMILDVSGMTQGELQRFAQAFAETFFHLKKSHRSPVHLFIEEAQTFIPQNCMPEGRRMLGAFERLAKVGRNYGVGYTLISQRPQAVHKEVLNQIECLCCLQIAGAHERKAIQQWVAEKEISAAVDELPSLAKGEVWVWSPQWLRLFKRTKFEPKLTYDASATPDWASGKGGERRELPQIDLEKIRAQMTEVLEEQKANDPKALRARVRELEGKVEHYEDREKHFAEILHVADGGQYRADWDARIEELVKQAKVTRAEPVPMITAEDLARFEAVGIQMAESHEAANKVLQGIHARIYTLKAPGVVPVTSPERMSSHVPAYEIGTKVPKVHRVGPAPDPSDNGPTRWLERVPAEGATSLRAGARRMLAAIAQFPRGLAIDQVAMLSDLKPTSGTFSTYMGDLRRVGFVHNHGDRIMATQDGKQEAKGLDVQCPRTEQEVLDLWKGKLRSGARRMFEIIVAHKRSGISRDDLAGNAGMSESSGTFSTYLGDIMRTGCFERDAGYIKVRSDLSELVAR